jgi:hypothetical protein
MKEKYNYSLNGIEHEITLNHNLKIDQKPLNEKILVSNKYLMKYINDLFDYNSIEYIVVGNSLLGVYIFNGINIFDQTLEVATLENNFFKIKKMEHEIKNDDFEIIFNDSYIKLSTIFFDNIKSSVYIYSLNNDQNDDKLNYINYNNNIISHDFYDIYPIKKNNFEEFNISVPNKIEKVLESYNLNLNYIVFSKKKKDKKKIIEEVENKNTINAIKENLNNFISVIKPFFY